MATDSTVVPIREVAEQIIQVRLPLPFALNHVNCYLLDDGNGWTILDTGLHWPAAEAGWQQALHELHISPKQIQRIVLTHMHPDHFGMAGHLQEITGAPISVGAIEYAAIERVWIHDSWREAAAIDFWRSAGLDSALLQTVSGQVAALRQRTMPHPSNFVVIEEDQPFVMGGRSFQPIIAPGHSDGQIIFYAKAEQLLLCGDQVLEKITPNIGLWPGGAAAPLQQYLASLTALQQLAVTVALPGHGGLLTQWAERIETLQQHHEARLAAMWAAVQSIEKGLQKGHCDRESCTALAVARTIFNFQRFSEHEIRFAVAETLAHLVHLVARGKLQEKIANGVRYFRVTSDSY